MRLISQVMAVVSGWALGTGLHHLVHGGDHPLVLIMIGSILAVGAFVVLVTGRRT